MVSFNLEWSDNGGDGFAKSGVDVYDDGTNVYVAGTSEGDGAGATDSEEHIIIWDASGTVLNESGAEYSDIFTDLSIPTCRWSPNGAYLAYANETSAVIESWDGSTLSLHSDLSDTIGYVNDVSWSPDGNYLAVADDGGATYVYDNDPANGFPLNNSFDPSGSGSAVYAVEYSPDSSYLASESDTMYIDSATGTSTVDDITGSVPAWKEDTSYIYSTYLYSDTEFVLQATQTADWSTVDATYNTGQSHSLDFVHEIPTSNDLLVTSWSSDVEIHDSLTLDPITALTDPGSTVNDGRFSNNGAWLAVGSEDESVYFYSITFASFSGTVTDTNSNAIDGATVYAINQNDGSITGTTTTASDGTYSISAPDTSTPHHIIVQWTDGSGNEYYALSKPWVTGVG